MTSEGRIERFLLAIAVFALLGACRTANVRDPADRVREVDQSRFRAMVANDLETLAAVLADNLVYIHSDGKVDSKEEFLQLLRGGSLRYRSIEPTEVRVRTDGNMAVVTGRAKMAVTTGGSDRDFEIRYTAVYRARSDHWQLVSWQSTRIQR